MFERKVYEIVNSLGESGGKTKEDIEKATYGLLAIIYTLLTAIAVIIIALLTGALYPTIVALISFAVLRNYSGGFHSQHPLICLSISVVLFPLFGNLAYMIVSSLKTLIIPLIIIIFVFALIVILTRAPVDTPNKPITSHQQKRKLKQASLIVVFTIFVLAILIINISPIAALSLQLGVFLQIIMLPPIKLKSSLN